MDEFDRLSDKLNFRGLSDREHHRLHELNGILSAIELGATAESRPILEKLQEITILVNDLNEMIREKAKKAAKREYDRNKKNGQ